MKSRLADISLKVIAVLGWDDSLSIIQITLQRKSIFTFQVEKQWQIWEQDVDSARFSMADKLERTT